MLKRRLSRSHPFSLFVPFEGWNRRPSVNKDRFVILRLCGPFVEMFYRVGRSYNRGDNSRSQDDGIRGSRASSFARFVFTGREFCSIALNRRSLIR